MSPKEIKGCTGVRLLPPVRATKLAEPHFMALPHTRSLVVLVVLGTVLALMHEFLLLCLSLHAAERSLQDRVIELERQIRELRERVGELEKRLEPQESSKSLGLAARGNLRDRQNWRALKPGITADQVRALLGEPDYVEAGVMLIYWRYDSPHIGPHVFFSSNRSPSRVPVISMICIFTGSHILAIFAKIGIATY
jgi:hypothetical protein